MQLEFDLPTPTRVTPLAGGANNRVYKLEFIDRAPLIYKQYFQHPKDQRQRLASEFSFLRYAWESCAIRNIPEPLQANPSSNSALYSYLEGRSVRSDEIDERLIHQIEEFMVRLNRHSSLGIHLPEASEGCFCIDDYLRIVEGRVQRLLAVQSNSPIEQKFRQFLLTELYPTWTHLKETTCKAVLHANLSLTTPLSRHQLCVSPSDFGFHNALLQSDGTLHFIDFEYAGWDDPCKTICDLFCQPRISVPEPFFPRLSQALARTALNPEACLERVNLMRPVMEMKWCCIVLNVFTHVGQDRRLFSHSEEVERKERQLILAQQKLQRITPHGVH